MADLDSKIAKIENLKSQKFSPTQRLMVQVLGNHISIRKLAVHFLKEKTSFSVLEKNFADWQPWLICLLLQVWFSPVWLSFFFIDNISSSPEILICSWFLQCFSLCSAQYFGVISSSSYSIIANMIFQYPKHTFHLFCFYF